MHAPRPPAAVVFDCDGLLLDTESAWSRAEAVLYGRRGVAFTMEHKRELLGTSAPRARGIIERHLGLAGAGEALMAELHDIVFAEVGRSAPPQPGATDLLGALRAQGVPVGVASNSPAALVDLALRVAGLEGAFDAVVTADLVERPKPGPDVYLAACRALGAAPQRAVALEDSRTGVAAARAAGLFVIGVPSFEGVTLPDAHLEAPSLRAGEVWQAVGLRLAA
jgi:HAD superfamily hydrolase (TIGR01509 family)